MMPLFHKVADLTGRAITGHLGIGGTDLGIVVTMPNGELLMVFGDTFEQDGVGGPGWRSPVGLIGHKDDNGIIRWDRAAGANPNYASKWWHYDQGGAAFSTVLPSDVVVVGDTIYLHVMVNKGLGNVLWTEIWKSTDNAKTFTHLYRIDGAEDDGEAQLWAWDYNPDDGFIYAYTTRFDRARGIRMRRIAADRIHDRAAWQKWGYDGTAGWGWRGFTSVILPGKFGESSLRRLDDGQWVWAVFDAGNYRIDVFTIEHPTANLHTARRETVVAGSAWGVERHENGTVAQLYGAYVTPGSRVGVEDGFDLIVSQWKTDTNDVYKSMQFRGTVGPVVAPPTTDTPAEPAPVEPAPVVDNRTPLQKLLDRLFGRG